MVVEDDGRGEDLRRLDWREGGVLVFVKVERARLRGVVEDLDVDRRPRGIFTRSIESEERS